MEEVKIILTQYKVTTDLNKFKGLLCYCSQLVAKFICTLDSFHSSDWEHLKAEFLHYYGADQEDNDNRPSDLVRFVEENKCGGLYLDPPFPGGLVAQPNYFA